ncbi:MAG TPA: TetR/AcrR family transcriptional regulator [Thermoleophilaceae bacterium]|jgi:AcrR family transcriptional regulator|nr:TetR/AcrR family transcriptional regulator [Thermoleophilaceae bacterium]
MGGRRRSEDARRAILAATAALLRERPLAEITVEAIAAAAGTSKTTIYRWWPHKDVLALDAVLEEWASGRPVDVDLGNLRDDLSAIVVRWVHRLRQDPFGRVVAGLVAELQRDDAVFRALYHEHFSRLRREPARAALERAIARGEIAKNTDIELTLDMLYGPIYHRLLHMHAPLSDRFASDVVATVVRGLSSPAATCHGAPGRASASPRRSSSRRRGCPGTNG